MQATPEMVSPPASPGIRKSRCCILGMVCIGILLSAAAPAQAERLRDRVTRLADEQGFIVRGLDRLDAAAGIDSPTTNKGLRGLLGGYDYVIEHNPDSTIKRLIILGPKRAAPPAPPPRQEIVLETRRRGVHHLVKATLEGDENRKLDLELMVDTGASYTVLPESTGIQLGLDNQVLETRELQTANGKITARIVTLRSLRLGSLPMTGVQAALVPDSELGGTALLGMNVLSRYLFILDDEQDQLVLIPE